MTQVLYEVNHADIPLLQRRALAKIDRRLRDGTMATSADSLPYVITEYVVSPLHEDRTGPGTVVVKATRDQGREGTMLHAAAHEHWLFFITKRGRIEVHMAPNYLKRYAGQKFDGMHFAFGCA